jgi:hypothetical protein
MGRAYCISGLLAGVWLAALPKPAQKEVPGAGFSPAMPTEKLREFRFAVLQGNVERCLTHA